ncbi:MAG TPA: hypothetical protein VE196_04975, partial [Pseudonocardiaceae bacterium]|nr:hypothetical protein [Pseudonocardiaceae bacterium]
PHVRAKVTEPVIEVALLAQELLVEVGGVLVLLGDGGKQMVYGRPVWVAVVDCSLFWNGECVGPDRCVVFIGDPRERRRRWHGLGVRVGCR